MVGWMVEQTLKPCLLNLSNGFLVLYFPMAVRSLCMTKDWACFEDICVNHGPCSRSSTRGIERYHKTEMVKLNLNYKRSANVSIFLSLSY